MVNDWYILRAARQTHPNQEPTTMPNLWEQIEAEGRTNVEDIKEVPPIPVGSYLMQVVGPHENVTSNQKQTKGVEFKIRFISAGDDVDQDKLTEYMEASRSQVRDITIRHTIWDSPYAMSTLKHFVIDTLGLSGELRKVLAEVPGQQFIGTIGHRPSQTNDGTMRLLAQIVSTAKAV